MSTYMIAQFLITLGTIERKVVVEIETEPMKF